MRKRFGVARRPQSATRWTVGALALASVGLMVTDAVAGDSSPLEPVRSVTGAVLGPAEAGAAAAVRPVHEVGSWFTRTRTLRSDVARLSAENAELRTRTGLAPIERQRLAEYDGLTRTANDTGYQLVAAHVVGMGPMQSFSRTVTLDAGTRAGIDKDMTVLNQDGLVGRVIKASATSSTVLLVLDTDSVVGARLGSNMEIGFLRGRGVTGQRGRLDLDLADTSVVPGTGDMVLTWGSRRGVPYVSGIPIGTVESVYSTPREMAKHAVVRPFADFTALDLVGVVVPAGTQGERPVIGSGGRS